MAVMGVDAAAGADAARAALAGWATAIGTVAVSATSAAATRIGRTARASAGGIAGACGGASGVARFMEARKGLSLRGPSANVGAAASTWPWVQRTGPHLKRPITTRAFSKRL